MIQAIDDFKQRFGIGDFIVVEDSGFMISRNIDLLRSGKYDFIMGARIRKFSFFRKKDRGPYMPLLRCL